MMFRVARNTACLDEWASKRPSSLAGIIAGPQGDLAILHPVKAPV